MTLETSKDQKSKQTSFQEDFLVNHSVSQASEKERMMTVTSGMKLLELLPKQNQGGLLEKMLTELLTSTTVQSCSRYKKIWKKRVSKSNVLLFQLQASVRGIKENGSGLLVTPTATQMPKRSKEAMERRIAFRKSIGRKTVPFSTLEEQLTSSLSNSSSRQLNGSSDNATRICNTKQERWLDNKEKEIRNKVWSKAERCSEQESLSNTW